MIQGSRKKTEQERAMRMGRAPFPRCLPELLHPGCSHPNTPEARSWVQVKSSVFFPKIQPILVNVTLSL